MTVLQNLSKFADVVEESMESFMTLRSFKDPDIASINPIDTQVFASIAGVLHECVVFLIHVCNHFISCTRFLVRFKNAVATYPRLAPLVMKLSQWFDAWHTAATATPPSFDDPLRNFSPAVRDLVVGTIKQTITRLVSIVEREQGKLINPDQRERKSSSHKGALQEGLIAALHTTYEGPGNRRPEGPRHDNDFEDISEIRTAPTHEELMSRLPPYLPANLYYAPHPAPPESMQRLLDIQFRLLREELTYVAFPIARDLRF
jgi:hypothetical protein